jgi:hypothetical protein
MSVWLTAGALAQSGTTVPTLEQDSLLSASVAQLDVQRVNGSLARLQIPFVLNDSRIDSRVSYYAQTFAGTVYVTHKGKIVYSLPAAQDKKDFRSDRGERRPGWTLTETLVGGKAHPQGEGATPTRVSSFIGKDPSRWQADQPTYDAVALGEVWPGIDVRVRAYGGQTEKLFLVNPGAKPSRIRMRIAGARALNVNADGGLVVTTGLGDMTSSRPVAYQEIAHARREVQVAYEVRGDRYGFRLGNYNPALTVVIDPLLQATYLGGQGFDHAYALAVQPTSGTVYVAGSTNSSTFPGTAGGAQPAYRGITDAFVARLSLDLTRLNQATYLGGSDFDSGYTLAIHPTSGDVYVAGQTNSTDFPGTTGGAQVAHGGGVADAFVARLSASLTVLKQATYLGGIGADRAFSLAIHPTSGEVYVMGDTGEVNPGTGENFPETTGGAQQSHGGGVLDAFVARLNANLTVLEQSTYLGGRGDEYPRAIAIEPSSGEVYVAGGTTSPDFPGTTGGAQPAGRGADAFIARLNAGLTKLNQATYLGGGGEEPCGGEGILALAIDPASGEVYVAGNTCSSTFPGTMGGAQPAYAGGYFLGRYGDAFVARLNAALTVPHQATYLGGGGSDSASSIALHPRSGEVYVAGSTGSPNFPGTKGGAQAVYGGGYSDAFVARLKSDLTFLNQATFLGGSDSEGPTENPPPILAIDPMSGDIYVAGTTHSRDFPGTNGGAQFASQRTPDSFVARLTADLRGPAIPGPVVVNDLVTQTQLLTSFDSNPVPGGPAGTLTIKATFKNTSSAAVHDPVFQVTQLSGGGAVLLNADGGPGGYGSLLTPDVGSDHVLSPTESFTTTFLIGLQHRSNFSFFVNLVGVPEK